MYLGDKCVRFQGIVQLFLLLLPLTIGYETMSASTSPGGSSTSGASHSSSLSPQTTFAPVSLPSSLPALPPLGPNVDPVALIDARIKVSSLRIWFLWELLFLPLWRKCLHCVVLWFRFPIIAHVCVVG